MDKYFHPTLYNVCNYLSIQGLKLICVCKKGAAGIKLQKFEVISIEYWFIGQRYVCIGLCNYSW